MSTGLEQRESLELRGATQRFVEGDERETRGIVLGEDDPLGEASQAGLRKTKDSSWLSDGVSN